MISHISKACTTFMVYTVGKSVLFSTKYEIFKKFYRIAAEKIVIEQTVLGCALYLISNKYEL